MVEQETRLEESAASLPTGPGVYLFKDEAGSVLYVGKAQNLRSRVRQYLSGGDGRFRIPALVDRAADVDVLVTENVKDALLLENELIKQYKPMFNVRLRDDKQYLALRLDPAEPWPRLRTVRKFRRDKAEYFGPYTSSVELKASLGDLRKIFPLRSCTDAVLRDYRRRGRPCIEYEMKRCAAPCCDRIDEAGYRELVDGTLLFLRGRSEELVNDLTRRMQRAFVTGSQASNAPSSASASSSRNRSIETSSGSPRRETTPKYRCSTFARVGWSEPKTSTFQTCGSTWACSWRRSSGSTTGKSLVEEFLRKSSRPC